VRIIGGFPAGGTVDIIARLTGQWLGERLGQRSAGVFVFCCRHNAMSLAEGRRTSATTETVEDLADHVRDADVLVIEATFLNRDAAIARDYGHLTAAEAATLAAMSNVKILVLTHISGRYPDEEILAEATKIFPNSRVAIDFDRIAI
jgi:hypothetical protein